MTRYYTVSEAAKLIKASPDSIRKLIRRGVLPAKEVEGREKWMIESDAVYDEIERRSRNTRIKINKITS